MPRCDHAGFRTDNGSLSDFNAGVVPARFVAASHVHKERFTGDTIKTGEAISSMSVILDSVERKVLPDNSELAIKFLHQKHTAILCGLAVRLQFWDFGSLFVP